MFSTKKKMVISIHTNEDLWLAGEQDLPSHT